MELLPLIRRLWARRIALAVALALAIAGTIAIGPPPRATSAIAWTRVALDTPSSQLVDTAPKGADSLSWRASLLMHAMATDDTQRRLARAIGVRPDEVAVVDPVLEEPEVPASLPQRAADAAAVTAAPNVLTVEMRNSSLPMLSLEVTAPDRVAAKRLADAAVAVLRSRAGREGRYRSLIPAGGTRKYQPFAVEQVADVRARSISVGRPPIKTVAPMLLFVLFAAGLGLVPLRHRPVRAVARRLGLAQP
jgi:hypothetical protein